MHLRVPTDRKDPRTPPRHTGDVLNLRRDHRDVHNREERVGTRPSGAFSSSSSSSSSFFRQKRTRRCALAPGRPTRRELKTLTDPVVQREHPPLILLLLCFPLLLLLLLQELSAEEEHDSSVVYAVGATKRRHREEPRQPRNRPWLPEPAARPPQTEAPAASPEAGSSVPRGA